MQNTHSTGGAHEPRRICRGMQNPPLIVAVGPFGDHVLPALCDHTPGHGLVVDAVASMARHASKHAPCSPRDPRAAPNAHSPDCRPDITLIHGAHDGDCALVHVTCPSVATCTRAALPAACHMPLATDIAATAVEHARYGGPHPHTVPPFVVEHAGSINKERMQFFRMCTGCAGMQATRS